MKSNDHKSIESFQEKLDQEYDWPAQYTFKFIVPKDQKYEVINIFKDHNISERESSQGNYVSFTAKLMAHSSKFVVDYYVKASKIEGVISL